MRRLLALFGLLLAVLAPLVLVQPTALAAERCNPSYRGGCVPDNMTHTFCFPDYVTNQTLKDAANWALGYMVNNTNLSAVRYACDREIDVLWQTNYGLGDGVRGRYTCDRFNGDDECATSVVALAPPELSDYFNWKKTACHELGHSIGLGHHPKPWYDCMASGAAEPGMLDYGPDHRASANRHGLDSH